MTPAQGTALVGGWAKIGAALESFLAAVLEWMCTSEGRDVREEIRVSLPRVAAEKITAGQLLGVVRGLAHLQAAKSKEVAVIYRDLEIPANVCLLPQAPAKSQRVED